VRSAYQRGRAPSPHEVDGTPLARCEDMLALRVGLIAILAGACAEMPERRVEAPQQVGPAIGESTAMGPADSTRPLAPEVPGGVPENVGPGLAITPPAPGAPAPTQPSAPAAAAAVAENGGIYILPVEPEPPPPVFQPPPPPDTYEIEDYGEG